MEYLVGRFERNGEVYPFIDTKFDPIQNVLSRDSPTMTREQ